MSNNTSIPDDIQAFLREHITSVDQLEMLLLFEDRFPNRLTAGEAAKVLYLSPESAQDRLDSFVQRGILTADSASPPTYGLNTSNDWPRRIRNVASCYKERRVSVINFIYSNPIDTIQSFADAFIIRKKKD